ncbi:MAG: hypothetical protein M1817_001258 [Caeruleum heppii]|nr:MAG: hypothetical protein M1817_001258 [Caeruleum heppii]
MPPSSASFTALNLPPEHEPPQDMSSFALLAPPNTDLWRKPPSRDTSTAPILYTALRHPFVAAEVTVSADWELEWDQGGLVIFAGKPMGRVVPPVLPPTHTIAMIPSAQESAPATTTIDVNTATPTPDDISSADRPPSYTASLPASKWVKAGLEFHHGALHASSVVATSDGADWALAPLSAHSTPTSSPSAQHVEYHHSASHQEHTFSPMHSRPSTRPSHVSRFPHRSFTTMYPSSAPQPPSSSTSSTYELRIKLERVQHALWIWFREPHVPSPTGVGSHGHPGGWKKLREVTWFFWGVEDKAVRVGVYASRPANFGDGWGIGGGRGGEVGGGSTGSDSGSGGGSAGPGGLTVEFEGLEIF